MLSSLFMYGTKKNTYEWTRICLIIFQFFLKILVFPSNTIFFMQQIYIGNLLYVFTDNFLAFMVKNQHLQYVRVVDWHFHVKIFVTIYFFNQYLSKCLKFPGQGNTRNLFATHPLFKNYSSLIEENIF